jgi:NADPH:quinone reductase-like Zn-dependent oxidoreductase
MRAVVLREFGPPENLKWETVPTPEPQAGEVLLRVHAVSVDLFQMEFRSGRALQVELPRIMGNGPAGEVAEAAQGVDGITPGQRVVVCNNVSCGICKYCRVGRETLCSGLNNHRGGIIGAHRNGGYAEFVTVPARNLLTLPEAISFEEACLIPNTIGPVVKACAGRARIHPGENVLIIGAGGGMGLHAVQMARACGGRVIAAIRSTRTSEAVLKSGADIVFTTKEHDLSEEVRRLTDGWGADVVLDFVATRETLSASLTALAPAGRLVIMGYFPRGSVLETPTWVFSEEVEVTGNRSAGRQDVAEAIALIQNGRIKPVVGKVFALKDAVKAHQAFEAGEIIGRAVLVV